MKDARFITRGVKMRGCNRAFSHTAVLVVLKEHTTITKKQRQNKDEEKT